MRKLNITQAAYIAGLIDGEGCLAIVREKNPKLRGGYAYRLGFRISNTNHDVMQWLTNTTQVGSLKVVIPKMKNSKPQWSYELWGETAIQLIDQVKSFLVIKKKQANLLIEFRKHVDSCKGTQLTNTDLKYREEVYHRSRTLNCRGKKPYRRNSK